MQINLELDTNDKIKVGSKRQIDTHTGKIEGELDSNKEKLVSNENGGPVGNNNSNNDDDEDINNSFNS